MSPGNYEFAENTTIEDLVLQAGGLTDAASTTKVDVSRRIIDPKAKESGNLISKTYTFELKDGFVIDGQPGFVLEPYDIVQVRRSPTYMEPRNITVEGEVQFGGIITLSTLVAFGDIRLPIYSIIIIFVESKIIDLVVDGMKSYKTMFIVTDELEAVRSYILNDLKRGGTCLTGTGLYQGNERKMIYVTLDRPDMVKLRSQLHLIDPHAFVNIMESSEILGLGFKSLPKEEKP
jgi:hypothetical protein